MATNFFVDTAENGPFIFAPFRTAPSRIPATSYEGPKMTSSETTAVQKCIDIGGQSAASSAKISATLAVWPVARAPPA